MSWSVEKLREVERDVMENVRRLWERRWYCAYRASRVGAEKRRLAWEARASQVEAQIAQEWARLKDAWQAP